VFTIAIPLNAEPPEHGARTPSAYTPHSVRRARGKQMFCLEYRAEYRDGFTVCADCQVDLVATLRMTSAPTWSS